MTLSVGLITGGQWHEQPYNFLISKNIHCQLFDDNSSCYLSKKFKIKAIKIKELDRKKYNEFFFWSPTNDIGSAIADFKNKNNQNFSTRNKVFLKGIFDKSKININKDIKISKKKKYLLKPKQGSGSRNISYWNYQKFNKNKFYLEEFYLGNEISIETLSCHSKHQILNISLRILDKYKSAIAIITINNIKNKKKIFDQIIRKLNNSGVQNGLTHMECKINKKGDLKFFDINLRAGGFGVTDFILNNIYKKNLYEQDFNILLNKTAIKKYKLIKKNKKIYFLVFKNKFSKSINRNLQKINKKFYFKKLQSNNQKKNQEIDSSRTELLFGYSVNKINLKRVFAKILKKEKYKIFYEQYKSLVTKF